MTKKLKLTNHANELLIRQIIISALRPEKNLRKMSEDSKTSDKVKETIKKFLSPNSKPTFETFPELVDCVVWLRFSVAVFFGFWIGKQHRSGGGNILVALNLITFPPVFYCQTFLGADQESYGSKLFFSGVVQSLALAMLIWIYFFTESHESDESTLALAFGQILVDEESFSLDEIGDTPIPEETEF